ncbi:hypothetical protein HZ326_14598 [Fusarium oxysporum f. sp. albedinis]|nr:hypothetical protein HZ326_14598 [Fusarium oxysporum f. sp. albedinis]
MINITSGRSFSRPDSALLTLRNEGFSISGFRCESRLKPMVRLFPTEQGLTQKKQGNFRQPTIAGVNLGLSYRQLYLGVLSSLSPSNFRDDHSAFLSTLLHCIAWSQRKHNRSLFVCFFVSV